MKQLHRRNPETESNSEDIDRLVAVAEKNGCQLSRTDAQWVWEDYSDSFAAGWLGMNTYGDFELWSIIDYRMTTGEQENEE